MNLDKRIVELKSLLNQLENANEMNIGEKILFLTSLEEVLLTFNINKIEDATVEIQEEVLNGIISTYEFALQIKNININDFKLIPEEQGISIIKYIHQTIIKEL